VWAGERNASRFPASPSIDVNGEFGQGGDVDDVIVIGGGIVGLSVAHAVAGRGLAVHVLDRPRPGMAATHAAAGMLSPLSEATETGPFLSAGLASLALYPDWIEELRDGSGADPWYRRDGKLRVADDEAGSPELEALLTRAAAAGVRARRVSRDEAEGLAGARLPNVAGAVFLEDDHQVDNRRLHAALQVACRGRGVRFSPHCEVRGPIFRGERVHGVRLADGSRREAEFVVVAAGAWTGRLPGLPGPVPVRPVRGQMLTLDAGASLPHRVLEARDVYLVPRQDGRLLAGATVEEAGFEAACTPEARTALHAAAARLVPSLAGASVREHGCGLRPGTPDGNPVMGAVPGAEGLMIATGHFRNGILLAPWTGAALARLMAGGDGPRIPPAFLVDRFGPGDGGIARDAVAHHPSST
jgi:glycine oxidase